MQNNTIKKQICLIHNKESIIKFDNVGRAFCDLCVFEIIVKQNEIIQPQEQEQFKKKSEMEKLIDQIIADFEFQISKNNETLLFIQMRFNLIKNIFKENIQILEKLKQQCSQQAEALELNFHQERNLVQDILLGALQKIQDEITKIKQSMKSDNIIGEALSFQETSSCQQESINKKVMQNLFRYKRVFQQFQYEQKEISITLLYQNFSAFAFNTDKTLLFIGCYQDIIVVKFENGILKEEIQRLSSHQNQITCLYFMKKLHQLISGGDDKQILIWSLNQNKQWVVSQQLQGLNSPIRFLDMNAQEDILISQQCNQSIMVWYQIKEREWISNRIIDQNSLINCLSINDSGTKLICGLEKKHLLVLEKQNDNEWKCNFHFTPIGDSHRLIFLSENVFVYHPKGKQFLELNCLENGIIKYTEYYPIKTNNQVDSEDSFPCQFIRSKGILLVKVHNILNFYSVNKNQKLMLEQSMFFESKNICGRLSDDGEFLVLCEARKQFIEVMKLIYKNE